MKKEEKLTKNYYDFYFYLRNLTSIVHHPNISLIAHHSLPH